VIATATCVANCCSIRASSPSNGRLRFITLMTPTDPLAASSGATTQFLTFARRRVVAYVSGSASVSLTTIARPSRAALPDSEALSGMNMPCSVRALPSAATTCRNSSRLRAMSAPSDAKSAMAWRRASRSTSCGRFAEPSARASEASASLCRRSRSLCA